MRLPGPMIHLECPICPWHSTSMDDVHRNLLAAEYERHWQAAHKLSPIIVRDL
jgi:hypothetical protein